MTTTAGPVRSSLSVVIIEDHGLGRGGLEQLFHQAGIEVVGAAASLNELRVLELRLAEVGAQPDVVVTDLNLPDTSGLRIVDHLVATVQNQWPGARIVVHTRSQRGADIVAAFEAGVAAYVLKSDEDDLVDVIRRVSAGATVVSPTLASFILRERPRITGRQRDVIDALAEGYSNAEIAGRLGISEKTVENHLGAIRGAAPIDESPGSSIRVKLVNWWLGR